MSVRTSWRTWSFPVPLRTLASDKPASGATWIFVWTKDGYWPQCQEEGIWTALLSPSQPPNELDCGWCTVQDGIILDGSLSPVFFLILFSLFEHYMIRLELWREDKQKLIQLYVDCTKNDTAINHLIARARTTMKCLNMFRHLLRNVSSDMLLHA